MRSELDCTACAGDLPTVRGPPSLRAKSRSRGEFFSARLLQVIWFRRLDAMAGHLLDSERSYL